MLASTYKYAWHMKHFFLKLFLDVKATGDLHVASASKKNYYEKL